VGFVAMSGGADDSAPKITSDPLAKSAAPVTSVVPRNLLRVTPGFSSQSEDFLSMPFSVRPRKSLSTEPPQLIGRATAGLRMEAGAPQRRRVGPVRPDRASRLHYRDSGVIFSLSRIRTSNASSRSLPKVRMPPSCPAMTTIFLLCASVHVKRCIISYAISGVP